MNIPTVVRNNPVLYRLHQSIQGLWRLLVEPLVPSPVPITQIHLLSLMLILLVPVLLTSMLWDVGVSADGTYDTYALINVGLAFIAYILNRMGRYYPSAYLLTAMLTAMPYVLLLMRHDSDNERIMVVMVSVMPSIICTYLLLGLRETVISASAALFSLALMPVIATSLTLQDVMIPIYFVTIMVALIISAALVRHRQVVTIQQKGQALEESESRFRDLFEATFEPIVLVDQWVIVDANPALAELLRTPLTSLIGRNVRDFVHPDDQAQFIGMAMELNRAQDIRAVAADGHIFPVEVRTKLHRYRGLDLRIVAIHDMSWSKQASDRQIELAIEREKVGVLQRFIGNMSHDLRTPLTVMKTSVYLMKRLKDEPDRMTAQMDTLAEQVIHLQQLFDDLLSMSKLDKADTSDYRFRMGLVNDVIVQAVDEERRVAALRGQTISFQAGEKIPNVLIDVDEFRRMIRHLIRNGLGYTLEDGTLTLRSYARESDVVIDVIDTGVGINPADLPHIFDRFYHTNSMHDSADGGTGLSLNIARKIAQAHGGIIEVSSEIGKGSIFSVHIPILTNDKALEMLGGVNRNESDDAD